MPILGIVLLIIQVGFAAHAIRRGHDQIWIYLIIFVPLIGCILYTLMVILPEARSSRAVRGVSKAVTTTLDPKRDLRKRLENLDVSDAVENRVRLAEELAKHGMVDDTIDLYQRSLTGIYATDPDLMLGLANAFFAAGRFKETRETLDRLIQTNPEYRNQDGHLLYARALEELGEIDQATEEYQALCQYYNGAEAKCRYGLLLKRHGKTSEAAKLFEELLRAAKRASKHSNRLNKEWIAVARREAAP
ncbi:MAG: tetratricopeptide repeat protein [Candidatus Competibacter sp.]|nr:tetratricopeptide repeat protein [Candidatus Competibacter sp.]